MGYVEKGDENKLDDLFNRYNGIEDEKDVMTDEGFKKFLKDVSINAEDEFMLFAISHYLDCTDMGEITRKEFTTAFSNASVNSLPAIYSEIKSLQQKLKRSGKEYKTFY